LVSTLVNYGSGILSPMSNLSIDLRSVSVTPAKGAIPKLTIKCTIQSDQYPSSSSLAVTSFTPSVQLVGVPIPVFSPSSSFMYFDMGAGSSRAQGSCEFSLAMYPHITRAIEAARRGDVKGSAQLVFNRVMLSVAPNAQPRLMEYTQAPDLPLEFSRDRWSDILGEMGYDGSWVIEITPPPGPGWPDVEEHLQRASKELRSGQPEAAARACRDAWAAASPHLEGRWEAVEVLMKRQTKKLGRFPPMSTRVATLDEDLSHLMNDARFLADTSAHGEAHVVGDDEALLIYRLSHTLLGYLSRKSKEAEPTSPPSRPA
jgi:hypothetical protein